METTKCPVCNATIEQGVTVCGNCKSHLIYKYGVPIRVPSPEEKEKELDGCLKSMSSLGCFGTLLITLPILFLGVCSIV
jgi:transcriptional regulator of NAD metabolism